jgi:hypothetical protein
MDLRLSILVPGLVPRAFSPRMSSLGTHVVTKHSKAEDKVADGRVEPSQGVFGWARDNWR